MPSLDFPSVSAQVAAHLRTEIARGTWSGVMPGRNRLALETGVNRKTVEAALRFLEREGVLAGQGSGRRRRIVMSADQVAPRPLRVAILLSDPNDQKSDYIVEILYALAKAGHIANFAEKTLVDLGMDPKRIARMVDKTTADAWVVVAASQEVLEWFVACNAPVFALFGRRRGVPVAGIGPDKESTTREVTRHLLELGHRRIVLLVRPRRRLPQPGATERAFLDELAAGGIATGPYNMPDWKETTESFHACLESLFHVTPPTALAVDESPFFVAALHFLAGRGLRVPEDVSLVCMDPDPTFAWCNPSIAHIHWDSRPLCRRVVRWAANISRGKKDLRQTIIPARFIPGGTVGPPPGAPQCRHSRHGTPDLP